MSEQKNQDSASQVEYMVRVKLPNSASFSPGPSGDTEYDEAYRNAISAVRPRGFEVKWPKLGHRWPVDSEGYTCVLLFVSDHATALTHWIDRADRLAKKLDEISKLAKDLTRLSNP